MLAGLAVFYNPQGLILLAFTFVTVVMNKSFTPMKRAKPPTRVYAGRAIVASGGLGWPKTWRPVWSRCWRLCGPQSYCPSIRVHLREARFEEFETQVVQMVLVTHEQARALGALREIDLSQDIVGELVPDGSRDVGRTGDVVDARRTHDTDAIVQQLGQFTAVKRDERTVRGGQLVEQVEEQAHCVDGNRVELRHAWTIKRVDPGVVNQDQRADLEFEQLLECGYGVAADVLPFIGS